MALENSPVLKAERAVVMQASSEYDEIAEFLDPALYAAGGAASRLRSLPLNPAGYAKVGAHDAIEGQTGVLVPIEGGAYVSAGGVFRRWFDPDDGFDRMNQHLLGVNVQIPLLRDRGFALYGHRRAAAAARHLAAVNRLAAQWNLVRRDVESTYISLCLAEANLRVRVEATKRFERLHRDASELARLKTIPDYQVQTALRDLQTGREDQIAAEQGRDAAMLELSRAVGAESLSDNLVCNSEDFLKAAQELVEVPDSNVEKAMETRGDALALDFDRQAVEAEQALEEESRRDQINLNMGVNWQGDSERGPFGAYRESTDHNWGGEVMVVWTRPLDYTGETARLRKAEARIGEIAARKEALRVQVTAEIRTAEVRCRAAIRRLRLVGEAVKAAQSTLEAEQERFRLGESTSAIVLDAQKELNNILLRQSAAAAEVLQANAELQYALGYPD